MIDRAHPVCRHFQVHQLRVSPWLFPWRVAVTLSLCSVSSGVLARAGASASDSAQPITWIFLNTGASRAKTKSISQTDLAKMQADHVGNFGTQFNRGTLMAAGPLGDNGFVRGTVILSVQTPEQIAECFSPDPFVQNGILAVEPHPWLVDIMRFGAPVVPFQLAPYTLCIVKKAQNWKSKNDKLRPDSMLELFPNLKKHSRSGELAISGPFLDSGDKVGLLLFSSTNQTEIQAEMDKEPAVAKGMVQIELHPQFFGKGTFPAWGENTAPPKPGKHVPLFDGKTFAGWEGNTNGMWRIEKGAFVGGTLDRTGPHNEFLATTREFKNFDLRLKVKLEGTGFVNGGVQLRSQRTEKPAFEMTGYQADAGEGYWACLYDESRRDKVLAHTHVAIIRRILKTDDWNDYIIRCEDAHIRLWLNGILTVDYTEDDAKIPMSGLIGLQIHGGGKSQAWYRDITIEQLR
jgi:uncharacterized protein YciI